MRTLSFMTGEPAIVYLLTVDNWFTASSRTEGFYESQWRKHSANWRLSRVFDNCTTHLSDTPSIPLFINPVDSRAFFSFFFATRTFSSYIDKELHSYLTLTLPRISPAPATVKIPLTGWEKWFMKVTTAVCSLLRMTELSSATWKSWVCQDFWKS